MDSDEAFLSIVDPDKSENDEFSRTCDWWSKFCSGLIKQPQPIIQIADKVNYFNGTMVRKYGDSGPWIGIQFKTKKDKLFFQLKFQ
jgi:hypothetical protein